jgi:hypothetical protein
MLRHRDWVSKTQQAARRSFPLSNKLLLGFMAAEKCDDICLPVCRPVSEIGRIDDRLFVTLIWKVVLNGLEMGLRCKCGHRSK